MTRVEAWAALYEQGATLKLIADAAGSDYSVVRRALLAHGVTMRPRGGPPGCRTGWHREIPSLRSSGLTYREIGQRFGVSTQAVQQAMSRLAP